MVTTCFPTQHTKRTNELSSRCRTGIHHVLSKSTPRIGIRLHSGGQGVAIFVDLWDCLLEGEIEQENEVFGDKSSKKGTGKNLLFLLLTHISESFLEYFPIKNIQKSPVVRDSLGMAVREVCTSIIYFIISRAKHISKTSKHLPKVKSFCLQPAHNNQQTCWNSRQPPKTRCFSTTTWFFIEGIVFFLRPKPLSFSHSPATDLPHPNLQDANLLTYQRKSQISFAQAPAKIWTIAKNIQKHTVPSINLNKKNKQKHTGGTY